MAKFRIVGISFDHMHMGDLLRLVHEHPDAEIAGLFDPDRAKMEAAIATSTFPMTVSSPTSTCMAAGPYDMAILCSATADHAELHRAARRPQCTRLC
jgi:predicted dehydrogenase